MIARAEGDIAALVEDALQRADRAMYEAKGSGRNKVMAQRA